MRRPRLALDAPEALAFLAEAPYVSLAWVTPEGQPGLRTVHTALLPGPTVVFHGSALGEKQSLLGRPVCLQAEEVLATIPSTFTDPERACPATTYYRSVQAEGVAEVVEDPTEKARALEALMGRFQPAGGHRPIDAEHPLYAQAVRTVQVVAVRLTQLQGKSNLGQAKPLEVRRAVLEGLWRRGLPRDPEVIERLRAATPHDPAPPRFFAPAGVTLHVWAPPADAALAAAALADAYWNVGLSQAALTAAHRAADAWVVGRDAEGLCATARAISDDAKHAWIYDVWVHPRARGRGVATALLSLLLEHPRVRGAARVHLGTKDAQAVYRKLGFEELPVTRFSHMQRPGLEHADGLSPVR
jgi:ribosomal protein S18 acetylase RimI-like enzyme/nitroimidazol reductase NimA-like FMN-containing flavoprotein (pyridoxamine 5'-phosphate oxidase superfamily)